MTHTQTEPVRVKASPESESPYRIEINLCGLPARDQRMALRLLRENRLRMVLNEGWQLVEKPRG